MATLGQKGVRTVRTFLVGYDLNKPDQDYSNLINQLKTYPQWFHCLDSTWVIQASETADKMRDALKAHVGVSDDVLVIEVTGDAWATYGFSEKGNEWLHSHMGGSQAA